MSSQSYVKKNFSLAWPLALNGLLMQSMLMIDTFLVSPLGEIPLAALGISTSILAVILGIQLALANGSQLVLSRAAGSGNQLALSRAFWSGLIINFAVGSFFWLLLTLFDKPLINLLTHDLLLRQEIESYLMISKYLILYTAVTQVIIALFNGKGKSRTPFKGYLIELPLNALLTYLFINGYYYSNEFYFEGVGVQGAAIASIIAITTRIFYLGVSVYRSPDIALTGFRQTSPSRRNLQLHFNEIFPVAANVMILMVGATVYQLLFSQLEMHAFVAITLITPWIRAGSQFVAAWSHSSAITISQAIGSKNLENINKNVNTSVKIAIGISIACSVLFIAIHFLIADIYPDLDQSTYQALAIIAPLYILLPIVRGYNSVHGNILRALGKSTDVFKINFIGMWVISIPLCALIIFSFDNSLFFAFAIQPFEELIRALPLRHLSIKSLKVFDRKKAEKLMYS